MATYKTKIIITHTNIQLVILVSAQYARFDFFVTFLKTSASKLQLGLDQNEFISTERNSTALEILFKISNGKVSAPPFCRRFVSTVAPSSQDFFTNQCKTHCYHHYHSRFPALLAVCLFRFEFSLANDNINLCSYWSLGLFQF